MVILRQEDERRYTPEEYLERERAAGDARSEYLDGVIYEMADPSVSHERICMNLYGMIHAQLRGLPCEAFASRMKVRTPRKRLFAYPDLTVVCGELQFHDDRQDILINPRVIFEVLSPSTEDYDGMRKRMAYQNIASLTDYVLVEQDEQGVEHWSRQADHSWRVVDLTEPTDVLVLDSIQCRLPLAEVYERVALKPASW